MVLALSAWEAARVNFQAGVDEAGLGPILGPLVVAGVAMGGPEGADPWQLLAGRVARERHAKGKLRVADSKKVHSGAHGLERLEQTVLGFWGAFRGGLPTTLAEWLHDLGHDTSGLSRCPWYQSLDLALPLHTDRGLLELQAAMLARDLESAGLQLARIAVRPVEVEEWNALIAETDNKSRAHFRVYAEVIARILEVLPAGAHLVADRAGGRMHYRNDLVRIRPSCRVEVVQEQKAVSVYRLHEDGATRTVTFSEKAENRAFPTALASCFAKYTRELFLRVLNDWFASRVPGITPTAGYFVDGHRFLRDLEPHAAGLALPRELLVRCR
jgi:hypothetical protein